MCNKKNKLSVVCFLVMYSFYFDFIKKIDTATLIKQAFLAEKKHYFSAI